MQVTPVGTTQAYQPVMRPVSAAETAQRQVVHGTVAAPESRPVDTAAQAPVLAAAAAQATPDALQVATMQTLAGLGGRLVG